MGTNMNNLLYALMALTVVTAFIGAGAIWNAIHVNKEKHGESPGRRTGSGFPA